MKSLFTRVILSSLIILVAGVSMISFGLGIMYKSYIAEDNERELTRLAEVIDESLSEQMGEKTVVPEEFREELKKIEIYFDLKIWLMYGDAELFVTDEEMDAWELYHQLGENEISNYFQLNKPEFQKTVFNFEEKKEYYTLVYPVQSALGKKIVFFLNKSIPDLDRKNSEMLKFIFLTVLIVAVYSGIIISIFNKKIIDEIAKINKAVNEMGKGNLNVNLDVERTDELGELSRNLMEMGESLDQIEQARRKFVSNVSHDLRSPMTSISAYINGMLDGTIPEDKWMHYLGVVSEETRRMIKLINNVLDLSRIQSGKVELKVEKVDLNAIILSLVDSYERKISEKEIEIVPEFVEGYKVYCDEILISRVLSNLLDNAIKFSPQGAKISIKTAFKRPKVHFMITNTGSYIEPDKLKFIWGRFNKLDDSRNLDKNSSGIGLAIVKEIIQFHEETIDVCSDESKGTSFKFSLQAVKSK